MRAKVQLLIDSSVLDFYVNELDAAHRLLDVAGVPRTTPEGERFSISQRVHLLVGVHEQMLKDFSEAKGGEDEEPPTPHTAH